MANHYEILGVKKDASQDEIRAAYVRMAKKYHPDKNQSSAHSEEVFKRINTAYQVLSDSNRRHFYDHLKTPEETNNYYKPPTDTQQTPYRNNNREAYKAQQSFYRYTSDKRYAHIPKKVKRNLNILAVVVGIGILSFGYYIHDASRYIAARHSYKQAVEFVQKGEHYQAVKKLYEAIGFNPEMVKAYLMLGNLNDSVFRQHEVAFINYRDAIIHAEKPSLDWFYLRGVNAFKAKLFINATYDFDYILSQDSTNYKTYKNKTYYGQTHFYRALSNLGMKSPNKTEICNDLTIAKSLKIQEANQWILRNCLPPIPDYEAIRFW